MWPLLFLKQCWPDCKQFLFWNILPNIEGEEGAFANCIIIDFHDCRLRWGSDLKKKKTFFQNIEKCRYNFIKNEIIYMDFTFIYKTPIILSLLKLLR